MENNPNSADDLLKKIEILLLMQKSFSQEINELQREVLKLKHGETTVSKENSVNTGDDVKESIPISTIDQPSLAKVGEEKSTTAQSSKM